ncbi:metallophosphoesterase [Vagococcus luciliae]|uniref:3',5'-cyclic adenosine monophosphate phosphodiesterase CpdA n=1 Tax=Vagococcus luciliae TaxID=2920380 RepID=A0ABY5P0A9_9ENTE|nr:metallophosphoesterase [Vagococcus luciliae]UUV99068.1 3',5'-cyclic adenosine monophosphate phosphodiesterase CpdA [Vagococcus luciliae]
MTQVKKIVTGLLLTIPLLIIAEGIRENRQLDTESIIITSNRVNGDPIKIAHLSDLQFPRLRVSQTQLFNELEKEQPDVVFLTGDTIDRTESVETTEFFDFLTTLTSRYKTYVINGNHEETNPNYSLWRQKIKSSDAIYLENDVTNLAINNNTFNLVGLSNRHTSLSGQDMAKINTNQDTLVLAHHPELFDEYINSFNSPLAIFSGHAHGGQWRLPKTDGLLSPDQGVLPKLTNGLYIKNDSNLIVSRGLANSKFPIRLNNYPHLIFTTIKQA